MMWMKEKERNKIEDLKTKQILCDLPKCGVLLEKRCGDMRGIEWAAVSVVIQKGGHCETEIEDVAKVLADVLPLPILERAAEMGKSMEAAGELPLAAFRSGWWESFAGRLLEAEGHEVRYGTL